MIRISLGIGLLWLVTGALAQDEGSLDALFKTNYDTPLTIDLEAEEEEETDVEVVKKKKKKKNPKIYYGIKTKRGFTKTGFGNNVVVELFHYLKEYEAPDPYIRDFYWYDFKRKKIVNSLRVKPEYAGVLHGHYVKKLEDQVLEEGYFYKGMKHGRWTRLNRHDILQDKEKYWKGWPREAMMSYYDFEKTQLKEVIPVHFGEKSGEYYAFHKNGNVAVTGQYKFDNKVGLWREFYPNSRLKREVAYPAEPFDFQTKPAILKEWAQNGELIFDRKQFEQSLN